MMKVRWITMGVLVSLVAVSQAATVTLNNSTTGNLVTVSGGDLYKPTTGATSGSIGSNGSDSNTWGTNKTAVITGPDIGSTWRTAAMVKVSALVAADAGDEFGSAADLARDVQITLTLGGTTSMANTSAGYAPKAYLWGIDTTASGTSGWWATAERVTQSVTAATTLADGVWNASASTWTFTFDLNGGFTTSDGGDIIGIAVVGNENAVASEGMTFREASSSIDISAVPEPTTLCLLAGGAVGLLRRKKQA